MSAASAEQASFLPRGDGERLAFVKRNGRAPGIVWLGGFKSDMEGNKARALDAWAARHGRPVVRFDYFGHGRSTGNFREGTITRWRDDALAVIDTLTSGRQILIGSSMGAWLALLCAMLRPGRVAGLLLIAPATDFTETLLWRRLPDEARRAIEENGEWLSPSAYYREPYPITRALIEDGRNHLLLDRGPLRLGRPVQILQGMRDPDVPWRHAVALAEMLEGEVKLVLVRNGDHRLSTPSDLRLLERELGVLIDDLAEDPERP
jgi:pimeloyl-ACP methyl ester carboxylesterase